MSEKEKYKSYEIKIDNAEFIFINTNTKYSIIYDINDGDNNIFHSHNYNEIFCVLDGKIKISDNSHDYFINKGDVAIIPPGYMHYTNPTDEFNSICVIGCKINKLKNQKKNDTFKNFDETLPKDKISVLKSFENFDAFKRFIIYQNYADSYQLSVCCLQEIIYLIKNQLSIKKNDGILFSSPDDINYRNYLIEEYINKEYNKNPSLTELSNLLHISTAQLQRTIKKLYNQSFSEKIINMRMENAKRLLKDTDLSVAKIATMIGYGTPHTLYVTFKKHFNLTPNEWKNAHKSHNADK